MTNVPFINKITNELSKRKLKSEVVANAILDIAVGNDRLDNLLTMHSTASEIDGLITKNKKDFSLIQPNTARTTMNGYISTGSLNLVAKLDSITDISCGFTKGGANNLITIGAHNIKANTNIVPSLLASGSFTAIFRATTDTVCAPYQVKAVNNGDSGTAKFTGGWHGQEGGLVGTPTATQISYKYIADGIDRTNENNIPRAGIYKIEFEVINNIMGYNTFTDSRYILQEKVKYTIIEGIIQIDVEITALEDLIIETYYGLQTQAPDASWNSSILFKNSEYSRRPFSADLDSGNKYSGVSSLTSQKGTYELETWVDNTYGLGQRNQVSDLKPSVFSVYSTKKTYQSLVFGIPLTLLAGEKAYWRGGWRVRNIDSNRNI